MLRRFVIAVTALTIAATAHTASADRVVAIGGAVTEILYALGKADSIVGIDTTSVYPPRAPGEKASVGYMRALSAEGVLGLRPSLIIANEGAGPKETMGVLQAAKVPLVVVPDHFTGPGIVEKVEIVAKAVGAEDRGKCIINQVNADLALLDGLRSRVKAPKRVMFVLSLINGRAMVSGQHTAADGIIGMAGAVNAVTEYDGYKPISDEAVIAAKPDIILAMERGGPNPVTADQLFGSAAFSGTPAATQRRFIAMDGLYLLGFGPRTARAARDLALAVYPDLAEKTVKPAETSDCRE